MNLLLSVKTLLSKKVSVHKVIYDIVPWIEVLGGLFLVYHSHTVDAEYILGLLGVYSGFRALLFRSMKPTPEETP
jgi:hypothetical protein